MVNHCPSSPTALKSLIVLAMPAVVVTVAVAAIVLETGLPAVVVYSRITVLVSDTPDVVYVVSVVVVTVRPRLSKKLDCKYTVGSFDVKLSIPSSIVP